MGVIALVVGELSAILTVDKDNYRRGLNEARGDLNSLARDADRQTNLISSRSGRIVSSVGTAMAAATKNADRQGNEAGGKLAQGINQGLVRNSPLIVAGVSAALAVGAPALMAGATGLFAGIGIVAAAQADEVQSAWISTWEEVRDGTIDAARPIEATLIGLAARVGDSFDLMKPRLGAIFEAVAPQIDVFADGILGLANNAIPGLQRAIERGMPVTQGLADLLGSLGTGMTGLLDSISSHAAASGESFRLLGGTFEVLLPLLGELLGQGAELATMVLPALNGSLGLILTVTRALGPALPAVVMAVGALKIASAVAPGVAALGSTLGVLATAGGRGSAALDATGRALHGLSNALPVIGVALAGVGIIFSRIEQQSSEWANALREGGRAAEIAEAQMSSLGSAMNATNSGFEGFLINLLGMGTPLSTAGMALDEAADKSAEFEASLSSQDRAVQNVTRAQNDLEQAVGKYGPASDQAAAAARSLETAQAALAAENDNLELAISGVTSAMIEQANQALAAANADYAYRSSLESIDDDLNGITEAQRLQTVAAQELAVAQRDHGAASEEAAEAQRNLDAATEAADDAMFGLEGTLLSTAEAAGRLAADSLPATSTELDRERAAAAGTLGELERLRTEMGANFPSALNTAIDRLKASGVTMGSTSGIAAQLAGQVAGLTGQIHAVPGQKFVRIDAPTAAQVQQMQNLGWHVTHLPNGSVYVSANTGDAERAMNYAARSRTSIVTQVVNYKYGTGTMAQGGRVGDTPMRSKGMAIGGKVSGPGSWTSDSVGPFMSPGGQVFLSDDEWVVPAARAARLGDAKMAALVSGMADIVMRDRPVRGFSRGGSLGGVNPATGTGHMSSGGVFIDKIVVQGTFDLASSRDLRRAAATIRDEIVNLERASR